MLCPFNHWCMVLYFFKVAFGNVVGIGGGGVVAAAVGGGGGKNKQ